MLILRPAPLHRARSTGSFAAPKLMSIKIADRVIGCIVGGAIGDALGGPYEGAPPPVSVQFNSRWVTSDDTQLTLATCEGLIEAKAVSPAHIADRFTEWFRQGRISGTGSSTLKALRELSAGAHWALSGRGGEMAAGNGAAMRAAPLAFFLAIGDAANRRILRDVCRITHKNEEAYAGALAVVVAIRMVASGASDWASSLLGAIVESLPDSNVRDRLYELAWLPPNESLVDVSKRFGCSGYVVESVPFALYAVQRLATDGFVSTLEQIVSAGGDTDTNASIAGQVAGAWLGIEGIPTALIERIPESAFIQATARELAAIACAGGELAVAP